MACSSISEPYEKRTNIKKNFNHQKSNYQNYQPNSRQYNNPYNFPNDYRQKGVYDYDQYYVAPIQYYNIEPERKNVINNKY